MTAGDVLRFQFGNEEAIWTAVHSRMTFWTGMVLVLITAIPRNYDQLFIGENPWRWIFGPLGFSLISGTWTFLVVYATGASNGIRRAGNKRESVGEEWLSFMGLFWMTAPIAWLYAIPVERFLPDPAAAAEANVWLLAIVATWRVLLLSRVLQVVCSWGFGQVLSWVLVAASVEVFAVGMIGGAFGKALMAGMAGMRMSPAEGVISGAFATAMFLSVPVFLVSALVALAVGLEGNRTPLPKGQTGQENHRSPWAILSLAALFWMAVAVWPQRQVYQSVQLDRLVEGGQYAEAIEFMSTRERSDFAPSRELPPKAYELSLYDELPAMIAAADEDTGLWVWEHLSGKMDVMLSHLDKPWRHSGFDLNWPTLLRDLSKTDVGRQWIEGNRVEVMMLLREQVGMGIRTDKRMDDSEDEKALMILEKEWGVPPPAPDDAPEP